MVADVCLHGFRKMPFTCSYLPGKSQVHMVFLGAAGLMWMVILGVRVERQALQEPSSTAALLAVAGLAAVAARLATAALRRSEPAQLRFEEEMPPVVLQLGLSRDGVVTVEPDSATTH